MVINVIHACRNCGSANINIITSVGYIYASGFIRFDDPLPTHKDAIDMVECADCGLLQLLHNYEPDLLYKQYWYSSSLNKSMVNSLATIVKDIESRTDPLDRVVVDIGTNDGTLLAQYFGHPYKIGFDPASNLKEQAEKNCDVFINDYFTKETYPLEKKAKVITAIAMFYDLPDITKFMNDVTSILAEDGMFVIQLTDLYSMLKANAFDNICAEHLEYYTLKVLKEIMEKAGLEIFDVSYNKVNGGSVRVFSAFPGNYKVENTVEKALVREKEYFELFTEHPIKELMHKVKFEMNYLVRFLKHVKHSGKKCFVLGASTKGNTLLQLAGIDYNLVPYALEVNKEKIGLFTVGSYIKIISEKERMEMKPEFLLVLPWHFRTFFIEKFDAYIKDGGQLVFPLPYFEIVGSEDLCQ